MYCDDNCLHDLCLYSSIIMNMCSMTSVYFLRKRGGGGEANLMSKAFKRTSVFPVFVIPSLINIVPVFTLI